MIAHQSADKPSREFAAAVGARQIAVLSKSWFLRIESSESDSTGTGEETPTETRELFAKPDDRWEANEIGARCPEPLEELTGIARERYGWSGESD